RVERQITNSLNWELLGTVGPNVKQFMACGGGGEEDEQGFNDRFPASSEMSGPNASAPEVTVVSSFHPNYRVVAFNEIGDSQPSNETHPADGGGKPCHGCVGASGGPEESI